MSLHTYWYVWYCSLSLLGKKSVGQWLHTFSIEYFHLVRTKCLLRAHSTHYRLARSLIVQGMNISGKHITFWPLANLLMGSSCSSFTALYPTRSFLKIASVTGHTSQLLNFSILCHVSNNWSCEVCEWPQCRFIPLKFHWVQVTTSLDSASIFCFPGGREGDTKTKYSLLCCRSFNCLLFMVLFLIGVIVCF